MEGMSEEEDVDFLCEEEEPEQATCGTRSHSHSPASRRVRARPAEPAPYMDEPSETYITNSPIGVDEFERMQMDTPGVLRLRRWTTEELMDIVNELVDRWSVDRDNTLPSEALRWACDLFGIAEADLALSANAIHVDNPNHINRRILPKIGMIPTLLELSCLESNVPSLADADLIKERLGEAASFMTNASEMLASTCRLMCTLTGDGNDAADPCVLGNKFLHMISETKKTPFQELLLDLQKTLKRNGWRQYEGRYYVPVTVLIHDEVYETHAWEEKDSIKQMIDSMCECHMQNQRWMWLTSGRGDMAQQTANFLISQGPGSWDFPNITFDRRLFAFEDGCYDANTDEFFPHVRSKMGPNRAAINFFDHPFGCTQPLPTDEQGPVLDAAISMDADKTYPYLIATHAPVDRAFMLAHQRDLIEGLSDMGFPGLEVSVGMFLNQAMQRPGDIPSWIERLQAVLREDHQLTMLGSSKDEVQQLSRYVWRHHRRSAHETYPTPRLDGILFTQDYDLSSCSMVYAMMGKMLYEVNELDAWQAVPFIIGKGGTGKSTLLRIVRHFYPPRFVANISSNGELKFGLSAVYGKLFWLCPEVKKNFCMDQGDFQSLVSGEEMSIAEKNVTARTVKWVSPGILCGNEVFAFEDTQESLFRRIIALYFECMVDKRRINTRMFEEMTTGDSPEFGELLRKCNMAYRMMVESIGERDIWDTRLVEEGIVPRSMHTFRTKFRSEIDSLVAFLEESDEIQKDPKKCMSVKSLLAWFKKWNSSADGNKRAAPTNVTLLRDKLEILGYTVTLSTSSMDVTPYEYSDPEQHNAGGEEATGANKDLVIGLYFQPST
jgi:hypothetical protein